MTGIILGVTVHKLQVDLDHPVVKQKQHKFTPKCNKVINEDVQKLYDIGLVRKVHYPNRLVNVVIMRKQNGR